MSPAHAGVFRWQCLVPCGGGFVDGNGGPMQTIGYMTGNMEVVSLMAPRPPARRPIRRSPGRGTACGSS